LEHSDSGLNDSQASFPSRLIVNMPLEQLRRIMRDSHSPNRHVLVFVRWLPCDWRTAPRVMSSCFGSRIMHPL
jgi:hypothetical protein